AGPVAGADSGADSPEVEGAREERLHVGSRDPRGALRAGARRQRGRGVGNESGRTVGDALRVTPGSADSSLPRRVAVTTAATGSIRLASRPALPPGRRIAGASPSSCPPFLCGLFARSALSALSSFIILGVK